MQPALHTAGGKCYNTSAQWVRGMPVTWEIPSLVGGACWMAFSRRFGTSVGWTLHLVKPTSNTTARTLGEDALPETSKSCGACRWEMPLGTEADSLAAIFYPTFQELHHQTFDNRWILVYFMKYFVSQSQNKKTVQTQLLGVDIRMVTVPGECTLDAKIQPFPVVQEQWLPVHIDYNRATMLTSLGEWSWLRGQLHVQRMAIHIWCPFKNP